jgi:flagellar hook protein FlgE
MISSLFSGISGLITNTQALNVQGSNIANVNTIGYKGSRATFADVMYQTISSLSGNSQIGRGAALNSIDTIFSQGSFESTTEATDLAIGGNGFFVVKDANSAFFFTRAGQFRLDSDGNLVTPNGYILQGKQIQYTNGTPSPVGDMTNIQIDQGQAQPQATQTVGVGVNLLDTAEVIGAGITFSVSDPATYNYSSPLTVYDSKGNAHLMTAYYRRTDTGKWDVYTAFDGTQNPAGTKAGTLEFDTSGKLTTFNISPLSPAFEGADPQTITMKYDGSAGGPASTQVHLNSTTNFLYQDGYPPGNLMNITVDSAGIISGHYTNGQNLQLYQVNVALISNPAELKKEGMNLFSDPQNAYPTPITPGTQGAGKIYSNSLEQSNVDLATEFVKMIISQRGFQANSRVVTTSDEILQELMNMKR